jgi:hypothetical protein
LNFREVLEELHASLIDSQRILRDLSAIRDMNRQFYLRIWRQRVPCEGTITVNVLVDDVLWYCCSANGTFYFLGHRGRRQRAMTIRGRALIGSIHNLQSRQMVRCRRQDVRIQIQFVLVITMSTLYTITSSSSITCKSPLHLEINL